MKNVRLWLALPLLLAGNHVCAQADAEGSAHHYNNVIRYNLSGALLFGSDKYIVFGYERVLSPHQSFSINGGRASLPKVVNLDTDSFNIDRNQKRQGVNISVDYRFYLSKENKYRPPHGLYIGPYYSYNHYSSETQWNHKNSTSNDEVGISSTFTIHTIGFELGYQFILWKRLALDFVMFGPGMGFYRYKAAFSGNISAETQEQLNGALKEMLTQKFPGMNVVFSDKEIDRNGTMKANTIGYRCIIQIGFNF